MSLNHGLWLFSMKFAQKRLRELKPGKIILYLINALTSSRSKNRWRKQRVGFIKEVSR